MESGDREVRTGHVQLCEPAGSRTTTRAASAKLADLYPHAKAPRGNLAADMIVGERGRLG
eukprot:1951856-Rhodomonas_salina.3